jgi:hypothetical protein
MSQAEVISEDELLSTPLIEVRTVPAIPPPAPEDPKLKEEHQAFLRMLPELTSIMWQSTKEKWWRVAATRLRWPYGPTRAAGKYRFMFIWLQTVLSLLNEFPGGEFQRAKPPNDSLPLQRASQPASPFRSRYCSFTSYIPRVL